MTRTRSFGGNQQILAIVKTRRSAVTPALARRLRRVAMPGGNLNVAERLARGLIARHGTAAARTAATHLNRVIDRGDCAARDFWACVVHLIHECQDAVEIDERQTGQRPLTNTDEDDSRARPCIPPCRGPTLSTGDRP